MDEQLDIKQELQQMGSILGEPVLTIPYVAPVGYFSTLPAEMLQAVKQDAVTMPQTGLPYLVDNNYFSHLPGEMLIAAKKAEHKHTNISLPMFARVKMAIAAALVCIISFGGYITFMAVQSVNPEQLLSRVDGKYIDDYLMHAYNLNATTLQNTEVSTLPVEDKDIVEYLDATGWE